MKEKKLFELYQKVRDIRIQGAVVLTELEAIFAEIKRNYPEDWLLSLEIYELIYNSNTPFERNIYSFLKDMKINEKLISNGLYLIQNSYND